MSSKPFHGKAASNFGHASANSNIVTVPGKIEGKDAKVKSIPRRTFEVSDMPARAAPNMEPATLPHAAPRLSAHQEMDRLDTKKCQGQKSRM
mmetsp:Transcript_30468/g.45061  ORF Transcript_30468/g.45061 Transcript_30468/m.45061 type:complete len:92 (-) Transcript_30468:1807-2082(-)